MSLRRALDALLAKTLQDEDGEPIRPRLIPFYPDDTLDSVRARIRTPDADSPLEPEVEDLLQLGAGIDLGHATEIRWDGNLAGTYLDDAFPSVRPVMQDGFGNSWDVEVDARTGAWGRVYFLCHDPPVVVLQAESFAEFLEQAASLFDPDGPIDRVYRRASMQVSKTGGSLIPIDQARQQAAADPVLTRAIAGASDTTLVADLRSAKIGDGFRWDKFGSDTRLARLVPEPIILVGPPE